MNIKIDRDIKNKKINEIPSLLNKITENISNNIVIEVVREGIGFGEFIKELINLLTLEELNKITIIGLDKHTEGFIRYYLDEKRNNIKGDIINYMLGKIDYKKDIPTENKEEKEELSLEERLRRYEDKIAKGICPECDGELTFAERCKTCHNCGWSACS